LENSAASTLDNSVAIGDSENLPGERWRATMNGVFDAAAALQEFCLNRRHRLPKVNALRARLLRNP